LHRCRYCLHFDYRVLACEHPNILPVERIIDPDETRDCPYFVYLPTRKAKARKSFLRLSLGTWRAAIFLLICFGLLYIGMGRYLTGGSGEAILEARLEEPGTVMMDETFDLVARVENKGKKSAEGVSFRFGKDTLGAVELMEVDPPLPPQAWKATEAAVTVDIGRLPAGEAYLLRFTFRPLKAGRFPFSLVVFAKNAQTPQILKSYLYIER
jgi:hypothetical protein